MEGARAEGPGRSRLRRVGEPRPAYETMATADLMKMIAKLEQQMLRHARELEFEEAAKIRDQIAEIRRVGLGLPETKAG
jgi:excinuclease ABC subunit B